MRKIRTFLYFQIHILQLVVCLLFNSEPHMVIVPQIFSVFRAAESCLAMPFVFSTPLTKRLSWTFPKFFGKCPVIREHLALLFIGLNVLQFKVSTGLWSRLCPQAEMTSSELKGGLQPKAKRTVGMMRPSQLSQEDASRKQKKKLFIK